MNNLLYIGLNGYAGAGKDTVAKMLKTILSKKWESLEECKSYYFSTYTDPTKSATFNPGSDDMNSPVFCIAYADQLKNICSTIFGIPVQRFYMNKSTAWVCMNDKFQYTEIRPEEDSILSAEEYYYQLSNLNAESKKYWMSLREILVYIGTYVLQISVNKSTFVNIVRNKIEEVHRRNLNLSYVIITDNRFNHELDFIKENNGITMTISRDTIQQLDNIAEHDLDEEDGYDYIIDNSGSYDDLFNKLWETIHSNVEFNNHTISLYTRDNINNYLRLVDIENDTYIYKLCAPLHTQKLYKSYGDITCVDPVGGPSIILGETIEGTNMKVVKIEMDDITNQFNIYVEEVN